jgi:hypothetical protein
MFEDYVLKDAGGSPTDPGHGGQLPNQVRPRSPGPSTPKCEKFHLLGSTVTKPGYAFPRVRYARAHFRREATSSPSADISDRDGG